MMQASPAVPVEENELFYEISPRDPKGRIYGLGSYARPAHNIGGTSSSRVGEILRLTEEVTYLREGQRRTDETMSHLLAFFRQQNPGVDFGDLGASTAQASPHHTLPADAPPSIAPPSMAPLRGTTDHDDYRGDEHFQDIFAQENDDLDRS
ncbi:hypothetical protein Syun_023157 [Stephania yunnanensis]|uniref:Uncharacterized protein n=1 Tax=Stephania yunnanensis TaxID=152371 RepID=A0AAP0I374_9MAGN